MKLLTNDQTMEQYRAVRGTKGGCRLIPICKSTAAIHGPYKAELDMHSPQFWLYVALLVGTGCLAYLLWG